MIDTPHLWPLTAALAAIQLVDAAMILRPPVFIQRCLDGVRFPRDWWWTLAVVKLLAAAGLAAGLGYPGVGFAANTGVVAYFGCACYAHYRARFLTRSFWINCLGMLVLSIAILVVSYAGRVTA